MINHISLYALIEYVCFLNLLHMKNVLIVLTSLFIGLSPIDVYAGKCKGKSPCNACTNCSRCKYCSSGGTCGTCSDNSRSTTTESLYSSPRKSSSSSYRSSSSGSVQVKGYYRKNGTYVAPHTRSAPRRRR